MAALIHSEWSPRCASFNFHRTSRFVSSERSDEWLGHARRSLKRCCDSSRRATSQLSGLRVFFFFFRTHFRQVEMNAYVPSREPIYAPCTCMSRERWPSWDASCIHYARIADRLQCVLNASCCVCLGVVLVELRQPALKVQ